ncbi:MAG: hypothetical protein JNK49_20680 [Planctomycetes bacterium]|nr:hypothetical protein [Planctomycetota bacterium]
MAAASCRSTYPRRNPTGEAFPTVRGEALDGTAVVLPEVGRGAPLLLLVGYEQNTQFDLDRWLLGLSEAGVRVRAYEVPTLPGLLPGLASGWIDGGMRRGIPKEDWGGVVTVYGDAKAIAQFTGNADGLPGRVILLDRNGVVAWFHDRGYSVGALRALLAAVAALAT